jgi:dihydroflavonol-4-reductase
VATGSDVAPVGLALTALAAAPVDASNLTTGAPISGLDPEPSLWPVLVTGGGGFVGGHVARQLAAVGHRVRALTRRPAQVEQSDPPIDWIVGDLRDQAVRRRALEGVRGVIHTAGWVSIGPDRLGISHATNVEATARLLAESAEAGAERFVYTSTLYSLAAGTREQPADEFSAWNLQRIDSAYIRTKRQAEELVLAANRPQFSTIALCPGMVQGSRDPKPTSTLIAKAYSRALVAIVPPGGIPIIDAGLLALAHRRALICGDGGQRYAVVGPYLSYGDLAALAASLTGRPRWKIPISDRLEPLVVMAAAWTGPLLRFWWPHVSRQLATAGFLRLYIRGDRADLCFGLEHPAAVDSIARSL